MNRRDRAGGGERVEVAPEIPSARPPWWLHPGAAPLLLGVPLLVAAYLTSEATYLTVYRTAKTVDVGFVVVGLSIYVGLAFGSFFAVGGRTQPREDDRRQGDRRGGDDMLLYCRWFVRPLFYVTVFGYLTWTVSAVLTAGGVVPILDAAAAVLLNPEQGAGDYLKFEVFVTVPGVTTLTQVGVLYATVEALLWVRGGSDRRAALLRFGSVLFLALARSLLLSERLALVEIVVPVVVVFAFQAQLDGRRRNLVRAVPFLIGLGAFGLFFLGEYFRSWNFYRPLYSGSYFQFAVERFLGYYTTAVNNAAVLYHHEPLHPLRHTPYSLFNFPLLGELADKAYVRVFGDEWNGPQTLLETYANPELNNTPPIGLLVNEFSVFFAPAVAFGLGVLSASLCLSFVRGQMIGTLIYPSWFVGLLEISRVYYWADVRYFPVLMFVGITGSLFAAAKVFGRLQTAEGGPSTGEGPPGQGTRA